MTDDDFRPTTYIAFLRGINVGTHNRMKMEDLREMCESLGFENVRTYIQSGNVVFETLETDVRALSDDFEDAVDDSFGYDISVMMRTRTELDNIVKRQPFEEATGENVKLYVTFLYEKPEEEQILALSSAQSEAEEFTVTGRDVYSRVHTDRLEKGRFTDVGKLLGISATRRAWNVVTKVHALANRTR